MERRKCYEDRLNKIRRRYREYPNFDRAYSVFRRVSEETEAELEEDREMVDCYAESLQQVGQRISAYSPEQIEKESAMLKSELLTVNTQFFSFISDKLTELTEKMKNSLRPIRMPRRLKWLLLNVAKEMFIDRLSQLISRFIGLLEKVAKKMGALSFAITLNYAFLQVSFTFETKT
jgi:hypothetical protein